MRKDVHDFYTNIYLDDDEVAKYCRPGSADTCIWLIFSSAHGSGFQCCAYNKPWSLIERFERGDTNAKRDGLKEGCELLTSAWGKERAKRCE